MDKKNVLAMGKKAFGMPVFFLVLAAMFLSSCGKTPEEPRLIVSADTLIFKGSQTHSLFVTTNNTERRDFYVNVPYDWIWVTPQSGRIAEGDTVELRITSYLEDHMTIKEDFLYLSSAYDSKKVKLVGLPDDYSDYTLPEILFFPQDVNSNTLCISNYGNTTLDYTITASTGFVNFSPVSGQIAMMQHADINVSIDRENLLTVSNPQLYVTIDGNVDTVQLVVEKKLILPNDVVDAEYTKATDLLVYVSTDSKINIYHPDTKALSSIALSYAPTCVSISPDGTKAIVGHDAHVTYVDLLAETVLTVNDISCDALDIVLTNNGWTYVFPRRDQWENIHYINVSTNNASEQIGSYSIYAGTKCRLHPSGKYLYDAESLSSSGSEKFDIQEGTPVYIHSSSFSNYTVGGDLWFEENGERLFGRSGNVFKTSEVQSQDLTYNGRIMMENNYRFIRWLDHLALRNEIYVVQQINSWYDEDNPPYVFVYNADNLTYKSSIRTEDFSVGTDGDYNLYAATPYFVFAHSNGAQLYVITKADGSGLAHEWAIQSIDFE